MNSERPSRPGISPAFRFGRLHKLGRPRLRDPPSAGQLRQCHAFGLMDLPSQLGAIVGRRDCELTERISPLRRQLECAVQVAVRFKRFHDRLMRQIQTAKGMSNLVARVRVSHESQLTRDRAALLDTRRIGVLDDCTGHRIRCPYSTPTRSGPSGEAPPPGPNIDQLGDRSMHNHGTAATLPRQSNTSVLQGLTPEQAALTLTAFSLRFISAWESGAIPTATEIREELAAILADNPISDIYRAMADFKAMDGGYDPDEQAHYRWCQQIVTTALDGAVTR